MLEANLAASGVECTPLPDFGVSCPWLSPTYEPGLVSVIIPTFDRAGLVTDAMASIAARIWPAVELIVVDDGSTDATQARLAAWQRAHPEVRLNLVHQANRGPAAARNHGLRHANGEFIHFLDSDDLMHPGAFAAMIAALRSSGRPYCLARIETRGLNGETVPIDSLGLPVQRGRNIVACGWMTHAALYRRDAIAAAGPINERLQVGEDTEFQWRIVVSNGHGHSLPRVAGLRRVHGLGHLSVGLSPAEGARHDVIGLTEFQHWLAGKVTIDQSIAFGIACRAMIAGIRLGAAGDEAGKREAFALIARLSGHGIAWAGPVALIGRPNAGWYYAALMHGVDMLKSLRLGYCRLRQMRRLPVFLRQNRLLEA